MIPAGILSTATTLIIAWYTNRSRRGPAAAKRANATSVPRIATPAIIIGHTIAVARPPLPSGPKSLATITPVIALSACIAKFASTVTATLLDMSNELQWPGWA